jgi:hypothetical protein
MSKIKHEDDAKHWGRHFGDPLPLNKFQIEKAAKIKGRQTLHNNIRMMKQDRIRWIQVARQEKGRRGYVEFYELTETGLYKAAMLNPDLKDKISSELGDKLRVMQETVTRNRLKNLDEWYKTARAIIESGKAPPNSSMGMEIYTSEQGQVRYMEWLDPWGLRKKKNGDKKKRPLSEAQLEKLLAAGAGKLDTENLTLEQKMMLETFSRDNQHQLSEQQLEKEEAGELDSKNTTLQQKIS